MLLRQTNLADLCCLPNSTKDDLSNETKIKFFLKTYPINSTKRD